MASKSSLLFLLVVLLPFLKLSCCSRDVQENRSYSVEEVEIEDTTFLFPALEYAINNIPDAFASFNTIDFFEMIDESNLYHLMINAHQKNTIDVETIKYVFKYKGLTFYLAEGVPSIYKKTGRALQIMDSDINTNYPQGFCFLCLYRPFRGGRIELFGTFEDPSEAYDMAIVEKDRSIRVFNLQDEHKSNVQP